MVIFSVLKLLADMKTCAFIQDARSVMYIYSSIMMGDGLLLNVSFAKKKNLERCHFILV